MPCLTPWPIPIGCGSFMKDLFDWWRSYPWDPRVASRDSRADPLQLFLKGCMLDKKNSDVIVKFMMEGVTFFLEELELRLVDTYAVQTLARAILWTQDPKVEEEVLALVRASTASRNKEAELVRHIKQLRQKTLYRPPTTSPSSPSTSTSAPTSPNPPSSSSFNP